MLVLCAGFLCLLSVLDVYVGFQCLFSVLVLCAGVLCWLSVLFYVLVLCGGSLCVFIHTCVVCSLRVGHQIRFIWARCLFAALLAAGRRHAYKCAYMFTQSCPCTHVYTRYTCIQVCFALRL